MQENQEVSRKAPGKTRGRRKRGKRHSFEFRLKAVKLHVEEGFRQALVCEEMGIGTSTLY